MIDFSNCIVRNKTYPWAKGGKISVIYDDELYMLKFYPSVNVSEYLGCHIFESIGIKAQETVLGTYARSGVN